MVERRSDRSTQTASRTVVDAKMSLSLWLRAGRANKGLSLEDVAKITKIQYRILERLEAGKLEGLPAEVFVRGFVRSFARCVGLDEAEALQRYSTAAGQPTAPSASARALVESMTELAPSTATRAPKHLRRDPETDIAGDATFAGGSLPELPRADTVVEMLLPETGTLVPEPTIAAGSATPAVEEPVVEAEIAPPLIEVIEVAPSLIETKPVDDAAPIVEAKSSKKKRGGKKTKRKQIATGTPSDPTPVIEASAPAPETEEILVGAETTTCVADIIEAPALDATSAVTIDPTSAESTEPPTETWAPKMPIVVPPSVPWRRPYASTTSTAPVVPTIEGVSPKTSPVEGGGEITITGVLFSGEIGRAHV